MMKSKKILLFLTDVGLALDNGAADNNTVQEFLALYSALEKQGHQPVLLLTGGTPGPYRATDRETALQNINEFDELCINREMPNFYGGNVNKNHEFTVRSICKFKGQISFYFCDPDMARGEYIRQVYHKFYELESDLMYEMKEGSLRTKEQKEAFFPSEMLLEHAHKTSRDKLLVYTCYAREKHPIHDRFSRKEFIDTWREQLFTVRTPPSKLFDVDFVDIIPSACYVGSNKPSRFVRLTEVGLFTPEAEDTGLIKFYGKCDRPIREQRGEKTERFGGSRGRVEIAGVDGVYEKHIASLAIGAPSQAETGMNHRFLQGLLIERSVLVDQQQDSERTYVEDDVLRDAIYFSDKADFVKKLEAIRDEKFFADVVKRLQRERQRIEHMSVPDYVAHIRSKMETSPVKRVKFG